MTLRTEVTELTEAQFKAFTKQFVQNGQLQSTVASIDDAGE